MRQFTESEREFLRKNALEYGAYVCAQKLNRSHGSVIAYLTRNKIPFKYKKVEKTKEEINSLYFIEEKRFLNFDFTTSKFPKELAYFLGFLWADGTLNLDKYVIINIVRKDGEDIKRIFSKLCDFVISYRNRENRQEQMTFYLKDESFVDFLKKNGKYPHSSESHEKILSYIPVEYQVYFLRGLIDGDGCFYVEKYKGQIIPQFSISSNYEQNWDTIYSFLEKNNIKSKVCKRKDDKRGNKSSSIRVTSKENFKKLINFLYQDNNEIYLKRKFDHASQIIEEIDIFEQNKKEKIKKYKVFYEGKYVETIETTLHEYCKKRNFCYQNFARLSNHPDKKWRGYQLIKI